MDKVRLGRALGYGTRQAAKTLMAVAEAAAAPNPSSPPSGPANDSQARPRQAAPARGAAPTTLGQAGRAKKAARAAGRSMWEPLATFSSALWLRVTGLFFALLAFAMATGAWRVHRPGDSLRAVAAQPAQVWVCAGLAVGFLYFAVSSFSQAARRERQ